MDEQDLGLKEDLLYLPFSHAEQSLSLMKLIFGIPLTSC